MKDFWLSCGHHLLDRDDNGHLVLTDDFLKVYLARPELTPPPEACAVERTLHAALLNDPHRTVSASDIAAIADADARENWDLMVAFRDHLVAHATIEGAYLALIRGDASRFPPLFVNQLLHVILRSALDETTDPMILRSAEVFFRPQRMTLHDGSLIAADEETISGIGGNPVSPLVSMLGLPAQADIDILNAETADTYWERSDLFDTAIDFTAGREGLAALARALEIFVSHLLSVKVSIRPLTEMQDVNLVWYVGLDAQGTRIGDTLWKNEAVDDATRGQVIGLFELRFASADMVLERVGNEPVYLILAMGADKVLRMKPQNILTGLPLRHLEMAT